ncbi:MAG: NAD(P)-dependent alcohol dehydrogenase [Methanobacteriota archaeon]
MKAVVRDRYGPPHVLRIEDAEVPRPRDREVLVRIRAASANAMDWHLCTGTARPFTGLRGPRTRIRGADLAGEVESVGTDVTAFAPGEAVFGTGDGTFAEFAVAREDRLARKPERVSFEEAAAVPVAGLTALQGLRDHGRVGPGTRVLVYGAGGGVGTFAVQIGKALGAHVTAATRPDRFALLSSLGADAVLDHARIDVPSLRGRFDVFFDLGGTMAFAECRRVLAPAGRYVIAGVQRAPMRSFFAAYASRLLGRRWIHTFVASSRPADLATLARFLDEGRIRPVVGATYGFAEAPEAIRAIGTGSARGKLVVKVA